VKLTLPMTPAHKGTKRHKPGEALLDAAYCRALLGIMVLRNGGGTLAFSQADLDQITGMAVVEGMDNQGQFLIGLAYPEEKQS